MNFMKMTNDEIRVKVAELCGWTFEPSRERQKRGYLISPKFKEKVTLWKDGQLGGGDALPNYPEDLNACAEMESTLKDDQYERYLLDLWNIATDKERPVHNECAPTRFERAYLSATPLHRCLAFLKVHCIDAE